MIFLILSIVSSTAIFVLFKLFDVYHINTLQAIVVNYLVAAILGYSFSTSDPNLSGMITSDWFTPAVVLGIMFISMFYLMALTAQKNGLSVASVASKMSVIIPVAFGIVIFKESMGYIKFTGIIMALIAVYLTSITDKSTSKNQKAALCLPFLVFIGSGVIDTSINYFAPDNNIPIFSATIFAVAALIGAIMVLVSLLNHKVRLNLKAFLFGSALGTVNYGSVYFLLKALRIQDVESSSIFTINNVAIVTLSTLVGLFFFKENISKKNWLGIVIAVISIILVTNA